MVPGFSIIIPTKDRGEIFNKTLAAALLAIRNLQGEIIVVNDSQKTLDVAPHISVRVVRNPKSGVASARNYGASLAVFEFVLFMDDDFLIDEEALRILFELKEKYPHRIYLLNWEYLPATLAKMVKTKFGRYLIHYHWTSLKGWLHTDNWNDAVPFKVSNGASYLLLLPKVLFYNIEGYNEQFPFAGAEDHDFCQRLIRHGEEFYIYPQKVVYHNESDRVDLQAFLNRRKRGAVTHKLAADFGYKELQIIYGKKKESFYAAASSIQGLILESVKLLPNHPLFDRLYFRLVSTLIAIKIYEGYTHSNRIN